MNTVPWTCDAAESRSPSGLHCSHSPTPGRTGAPQRAQRMGRLGGPARAAAGVAGAVGVTGSMVPRTRRRSTTAVTSGRRPRRARRRRRSCGRARSPRRRRPRASAPRSRAAPAIQRRVADRLVAEPVALEPDEDASGPRAACRPPRAPRGRAAGSPRSCRRMWSSRRRCGAASRAPAGVSPPTMIGGAGSGTGMRDGVGQRVERRRPGDRAAGPQGADDGDGLLEPGDPLGRLGEVDAVGRVLLRRAADADARGSSRPPLAIWRVDAIRATSAGWRFITFITNGPTVTRASSAPRPSTGSSSTRRPGRSGRARPMKWSHAPHARRSRPHRAGARSRATSRARADRPEADPDRQPVALAASRHA